ncbi:MAG: phosphate-starvation-inducible PsiE family protein [Acidimicrobiia bacterium]
MGEAVEQKKEEERASAEQDGRRPDEDQAERTRSDQEDLPEPDEPAEVPAPVAFLGQLQDLVYYGIAVILLVLGAGALAGTVADFFSTDDQFAQRITHVVNGVLFVVIVLELLRTILAHFQDSTFHLKPFLIIGIISVVRHILTVGAELSIEEEKGSELFHRSDVELAVNALVVVALVVGLVLVRKTE